MDIFVLTVHRAGFVAFVLRARSFAHPGRSFA